MAQPSVNDVHVDAVLTNISTAYIQDQSHFIAGQFAPRVPVGKQSDLYYTYTKADWFRDEAKRRTGASESAGGGYTLSTSSYFSHQYSFHKDVDGPTKANSDSPLRWRDTATKFVTQRLLLRKEIEFVDTMFKTGVWATDNSSAINWDDYVSSDPIGDVEVGKETVLKNTGYEPNTLLLGHAVFRALKNHPEVMDRIKYTQTADSAAAESLLASLFGVDRVLVAKAIKNTAVEGAAASTDFTHGKHALLAYVNPAPELEAPSAAYTFAWTELFADQGVSSDMVITSMEMPEKNRSTRIEGDMCFDLKVVGADLGYFFSSVVS